MLQAIESGRAEAAVEEERARPIAARPAPIVSSRPIPFAATLTAAAALAACGGGGGGGSGGVALSGTTPNSSVNANSNTGATEAIAADRTVVALPDDVPFHVVAPFG